MQDSREAVRLRVGKNVRQLRRLRGLNQEQLAELVGNTPKHISQVERGGVNVTVDILTAVSQALAVDVAELFTPLPGETAGPRMYTITGRELGQIEQALRALERVKRPIVRRMRVKGD